MEIDKIPKSKNVLQLWSCSKSLATFVRIVVIRFSPAFHLQLLQLIKPISGTRFAILCSIVNVQIYWRQRESRDSTNLIIYLALENKLNKFKLFLLKCTLKAKLRRISKWTSRTTHLPSINCLFFLSQSSAQFRVSASY